MTPRPKPHHPRAASWVVLAATLLVSAVSLAAGAQSDRLLRRWVGTHLGRPLFFDFYSDTMLVVNDQHALDFRATRDSLTAWGDTSFVVEYRFVRDKMLILNAEGNWVTMSPQQRLARPFHGRWMSDFPDGSRVLLVVYRGGVAQWRHVPGGSWTRGEWIRDARSLTFTWLPDSVEWVGVYDAPEAIIVEDTTNIKGLAIFNRYIRGG